VAPPPFEAAKELSTARPDAERLSISPTHGRANFKVTLSARNAKATRLPYGTPPLIFHCLFSTRLLPLVYEAIEDPLNPKSSARRLSISPPRTRSLLSVISGDWTSRVVILPDGTPSSIFQVFTYPTELQCRFTYRAPVTLSVLGALSPPPTDPFKFLDGRVFSRILYSGSHVFICPCGTDQGSGQPLNACGFSKPRRRTSRTALRCPLPPTLVESAERYSRGRVLVSDN
jgi:hypothetical protein